MGDEVLGAAARPLGGDDERAVLLEAAGVAQVLDVLARRAPPAGVPALGRLGPPGVAGRRHPGAQLGELGADLVGRRRGGAGGGDGGPVGLGQREEDVPGLHGIAGGHRHRVDAAGRGGLDHVLHLHGLEHDELGAGGHVVSGRHGDPEHGAGEGRPQLGQPGHRGSGTSKPTGEPQVLRYETWCTGSRPPTPQVPVG